jgi:hypothetical protein
MLMFGLGKVRLLQAGAVIPNCGALAVRSTTLLLQHSDLAQRLVNRLTMTGMGGWCVN